MRSNALAVKLKNAGKMTPFVAVAVAQVALAIAILTPINAQADALAPSAYEIDHKTSAALSRLYSQNAGARALGAKAKGVLVFPDIRKGAFILGAQYGYGALRRGRTTIGYYRTSAASYGFQAGLKQFGYALFFMTPSALDYLEKSGGWAIGTGPSIVVVDQGMARSLTTTSARSDVYAFVFDQKGLMGGMGIEGSKITHISPGS